MIDNNYIHHTLGENISSQAFSWNAQISNNELAYVAHDGFGGRTCTLENSGCGDHNIYWQGPGVHIVDNYFHHNMDGVDGWLLCVRTNGLIERNIFSDGNEGAISYFNDHDCDSSYLLDIRNNLAYNINGRGFAANAGNADLYAYVYRTNLYHNTFVITPGARTPIQDHYSPVQFMNWATGGPVAMSGNIIDFEGQTASSQYYAWVTSGSSYWLIDRAQAQNIYTPYSVAETSVFNNKAGDDYHLKSGSPAVDGASLFNWVSVDVDSTARTAVDDIGAYEYTGGGTPAPTLSSINPSSGTTAGGTSNGVTYTYNVPAPTLSSLSPTSGTTSGGTSVTLTGTNLTGCSAVSFGGTAATGIVVMSATQVRCTSPAKSAGTYSVTATTAGGTSNGVNYTYTSGGAPTTTTLTSTKDCYVYSYTGGGWGSFEYMGTFSTTAYYGYAFLAFDISGINGNVTSAKLRLCKYTNNSCTFALSAYKVDNDSWAETIQWAQKPAHTTPALDTISGTARTQNNWYEWTVTSFVNTEVNADATAISFMVTDSSAAGGYTWENWYTRESANDPQLVVIYQ